jgi:uncharacterized protein YbaR (Trm112 family)
MYLPLTDHLTCPRCGPEHGLILLADQIVDRRVLEGTLGCSRCREHYPVAGGFVDLRIPDEAEVETESEELPGEDGSPVASGAGGEAGGMGGREPAIRLAALLGLAEGAGYAMVLGPGVVQAPGIAALVEGIEVVAIDPMVRDWREEGGVSRVGVSTNLPFRSLSMRGVAVTGGWMAPLEEVARVLAQSGRLVLDPAPANTEARLTSAGLAVLAREGETLIAVRT